MINWHWQQFNELSTATLFDILKLRQQVFVVEQNCAYPDIDELDKTAMHLYGVNDSSLVAYLRLLPPTRNNSFTALGRIVTDQTVRGKGYGKSLLTQGIEFADKHYASSPIKISAQVHLQEFYMSFGFKTVSSPYDEDGIMHVDMRRDHL